MSDTDARIIGFTQRGQAVFAIAGAQEGEGAAGEGDGSEGGEGEGGEGGAIDYKAEAEKWKALSRKHEKQAKENSDAAKRLKEAEDADKSEVERATARAADAESKAKDAESRALRLEVAAGKGLTPAQARRLVGETKEELEADADELLTSFNTAGTAGDGTDTGAGTGRPREALKSGAASQGTSEELDRAKVLSEIPRA